MSQIGNLMWTCDLVAFTVMYLSTRSQITCHIFLTVQKSHGSKGQIYRAPYAVSMCPQYAHCEIMLQN